MDEAREMVTKRIKRWIRKMLFGLFGFGDNYDPDRPQCLMHDGHGKAFWVNMKLPRHGNMSKFTGSKDRMDGRYG